MWRLFLYVSHIDDVTITLKADQFTSKRLEALQGSKLLYS